MQTTVVEIDHEDYIRWPAVPSSPTNDVYFLKDGKIAGVGRIGARYAGHVTVYIDKDKLEGHFLANDYAVKELGAGTPFKFWEATGWPDQTFSDEPEDRLEGITIVSKWEFDYGFASKKRYGDIEGFGKALTKEKEETQLDRDRRQARIENDRLDDLARLEELEDKT